VRITFTRFPHGGGFIARPCAQVRLGGDATRTIARALIDTGSLHTVIPSRFTESLDLDLGRPIERVNLRFGGVHEDSVPVHALDLVVVSPDPAIWPDIEIDAIPVACCRTTELPFFILGTSALMRMVFLVREYDQTCHLKPMEAFMASPHFGDAAC
jgi:hypothetical protein